MVTPPLTHVWFLSASSSLVTSLRTRDFDTP